MIRTWVRFKMEYTPKLVILKGNIVINHDNRWTKWDLVISDKAIQEKISKNLDKKRSNFGSTGEWFKPKPWFFQESHGGHTQRIPPSGSQDSPFSKMGTAMPAMLLFMFFDW